MDATQLLIPNRAMQWDYDSAADVLYRTHLRSFKKYAKMIGAVYLNHNGLLKQSD